MFTAIQRLLVIFVLLCASLTHTWADEPQRVIVGSYLNNVDSIDLANNTYYVNAWIWFKWRGDFDPTEQLNWVNLNDAWAITLEPFHPEPIALEGGYRYQKYYLEAKFFHKFWLGTFPLDWQKVVVEFEPRNHTREQIELVPDTEHSAVNPDLRIPGWKIMEFYNEEKMMAYTGNFGRGNGEPESYSRYRFGVKIQRPLNFFFYKIIPPILIVLLSCIIILMVDPSYVDLRIGTPIGALLTEVFLYLSFVAPLPSVGIMLLLDHIFNFCYLITFLILVVAIWTSRLQGQVEAIEEALDDDPAERIELEGELDQLRWSIATLDRWAIIGFPIVLLLGIFFITLAVRGSHFFTLFNL